MSARWVAKSARIVTGPEELIKHHGCTIEILDTRTAPVAGAMERASVPHVIGLWCKEHDEILAAGQLA